MDNIIIFWLIASPAVGALVGRRRGRVGSGVVWGLMLGPLGWLIVALLDGLRPRGTKTPGGFRLLQ